MREVAIGEFKQTCLRLIETVRRTGRPLLVTKRGEPVALVGPAPRELRRKSWRGALKGTARILGDVVAPAAEPERWDALQPPRRRRK